MTNNNLAEEHDSEAQQTFISHLIELRNRLLIAITVLFVLFLALMPFANNLYEFFAAPLMQALPAESSMISTEPHGSFFVPLKLVFFISITRDSIFALSNLGFYCAWPIST